MTKAEHLALLHAESIGVYEYSVKGNIMTYYSYFGQEGIYKVDHNLKTGTEIRRHLRYKRIPKYLNGKYNYFTG